MPNDKIKSALNTWIALNAFLRKASEAEVLEALETEKKGAKRPHIMIRVHATYNKLRARREREELRAIKSTKDAPTASKRKTPKASTDTTTPTT